MVDGKRDQKKGKENRKYYRKNKKKVKCTKQWVIQGNKTILYGDSAFTLNPSTARYAKLDITEIALGNLITNRQSNVIYAKSLRCLHTIRNAYTGTPRYVRFFLLRVRGAGVVPSSTFTDLFTDASYGISGPSGLDDDMTYRFNRVVYEVLWSRVVLLAAANAGTDIPSKRLEWVIPINKFVSYEYNSNKERKGRLIYGWLVTESAGVSVNATQLYQSYTVGMQFGDAYPQECIRA